MSTDLSGIRGSDPVTVLNSYCETILGKLQDARACVLNSSLKERFKQHKTLIVALSILLATVIVYHLRPWIWKICHTPGASSLPTSLRPGFSTQNRSDPEDLFTFGPEDQDDDDLELSEKAYPLPSDSEDDGVEIEGDDEEHQAVPGSKISAPNTPASSHTAPSKKIKSRVVGLFIDQRSREEKLSDAFDRLIHFALREMPDKFFHEVGVFRISMGASSTKIWERYLMGKKPGERSRRLEALDGLMVAYLLKRCVRQMNLFSGDLHREVLAFGENPPETANEQIRRLQELVQELPVQKVQQLKLFIELLHRVSRLSDINGMTLDSISKSINDTLSPTSGDPSILNPIPLGPKSSLAEKLYAQRLIAENALKGDDGAVKVRTFTNLLITHYHEVFGIF